MNQSAIQGRGLGIITDELSGPSVVFVKARRLGFFITLGDNMKIEIDLNDILGDETGAESLADSVRRQIIDRLTNDVRKNIGAKVDAEVASEIQKCIKAQLEVVAPNFISELLDAEYICVDRWGDRSKGATTFRKEMIKAIHEEMKYKKGNYRSDNNAFTNAVDELVSTNVKDFQKDFTKMVNQAFVSETMDFAVKTIKEKLKLGSPL